MNVLVMYDRETDSLWSQILGEAVEGDLAGSKLTPLPAQQTTWQEWKKLFPNTLALDKGFPGLGDPYTSYYQSNRAGVLGETREDDRLPRKELGLALMVAEQPAYYPFSRLSEVLAVNDEVASQPLLVVFHPEAQTASAFRRLVDGQPLTFTVHQEAEDNAFLVDDETGSHWSLQGAAFDGPLAGTSLERLPATTSFWFGWKDWHPDTYVYDSER
jgi:hypothetical protein